jgi:hypothetical protein
MALNPIDIPAGVTDDAMLTRSMSCLELSLTRVAQTKILTPVATGRLHLAPPVRPHPAIYQTAIRKAFYPSVSRAWRLTASMGRRSGCAVPLYMSIGEARSSCFRSRVTKAIAREPLLNRADLIRWLLWGCYSQPKSSC